MISLAQRIVTVNSDIVAIDTTKTVEHRACSEMSCEVSLRATRRSGNACVTDREIGRVDSERRRFTRTHGRRGSNDGNRNGRKLRVPSVNILFENGPKAISLESEYRLPLTT